MIDRLKNFVWDLRDRQRIAIALARGGAMMRARRIDLAHPSSWEFAGFSQNGEDGILDVLRGQLGDSNRYVVEIGAADGMQNNSAWLVVAERFGGLMVEGDNHLARRARRLLSHYSIGAEFVAMFVGRGNAHRVVEQAMHRDPDVFSLDIDGIDYYVAEAVLNAGLRPKIIVVEYNSAFGPERSCTVAYRDDFVFTRIHPTHLYYGVSIAGWKTCFARHGYRFVTADSNGVNAFFADPAQVAPAFLHRVVGLPFVENRHQLTKFRAPHAEQFKLIASEQLVDIS